MRLVLLAVLLLFAAPLHARWHEAQTEHFVIYADDSEEDIRRFATMLESFHGAMELLTGQKVENLSPSNRVTIFAVGSERDMDRLTGSKTIAGFYSARAGFSRAFVPNIRAGHGDLDFSMTVLLHEYIHHFLMSSSRFAMPRWLNEGAAEFWSAAQFPRSGHVSLGRPAVHRAAELQYAHAVSIRELLDYDLYRKSRNKRGDDFYGRSWLLYHYLFFDEERKGQLTQYWRELAGGKSALVAAEAAFGDLDQLNRDLDRYSKARRMSAFNLPPEMLPPIGAITVRPLSEGHAAVMPLIIRSQSGVNSAEAAEVVGKVREVAARFPDDAWIQAALAEAEFDAGDNVRAIAAADRAIALNPKVTNAYVQKGYALFRQAEAAEDKEAAYKEAMKPFAALNQIENDHPLPLIYYYRSYMERGLAPPDHARHALERAAQLAPFDHELWLQAGLMQAGEGKIALARNSLEPIAANPHGGRLAVTAAALVAALEEVPEGTEFNPRQMLAQLEAAAEDTVAN